MEYPPVTVSLEQVRRPHLWNKGPYANLHRALAFSWISVIRRMWP
ncbi:hypothetical protein [Yoonia sp.]|nr:hypothetical protein [Yoonia sp.]